MSQGTGYLLPSQPVASVAEHSAMGGGEALRWALRVGPEAVAAEIRAAGLRGRGGAGFPTGIKWQGLQRESAPVKYFACNAAEGEPGTFKDRALMRANPYQLVEGVAIAAFAVDAAEAYIGVKVRFEQELSALERAIAEMAAADLLGPTPITISTGPDDYLFGEEKGLLEVIDGRDPLPTLYPPYIRGLFADEESSNPTVVNNVETLSHVPHILRNGAEWFRSHGTEDSPGTMVFTISGDVRRETVTELPMGTPLAVLLYGFGEGLAAGRRPKAVISGVANAPLPPSLIETPMDFGSMQAVGTGLGSGGFMVYDDTACMVRVAAVLSKFNWVESCGQCPPCKLGTEALTARFEAIDAGRATAQDLEEAVAWTSQVTDANRCGLGQGERNLATGMLEAFWDEFAAHLDGGCPSDRRIRLPKLIDYDPEAGRFTYDEGYLERRLP
ncbi:MAG: NADH-ubiquinone oxidoreductase-F iron-sulfur binding region domain-containing protein [Acidimicrobiia bacterium]